MKILTSSILMKLKYFEKPCLILAKIVSRVPVTSLSWKMYLAGVITTEDISLVQKCCTNISQLRLSSYSWI